MPHLCPRVYILLLLPLIALSCSSPKSPQDIAEDYQTIIQTELIHASENVENSLKNKACRKFTPDLNCHTVNYTISQNISQSLVASLLTITCKMKNLRVSQTRNLTETVTFSIECPCPPVHSTKAPKVRDRTSRNKRHNHKHRKLCQTKEWLSVLNECFELLNSSI